MNNKLLIKVCGMRKAENIRDVEALGIDWMGFICWPKSSRNVDCQPSYLPEKCERVGVFVDADIEFIKDRIEMLHLTRLQLHGKEAPEKCLKIADETGLPITKVVSVNNEEDIKRASLYEGIADYLLFDTKCKCVGGSGEQFDWDILQHYTGTTPFLLAGGIGPGDEERVCAFHHSRFVGIDLNSRFEIAPALKDTEKLKTFISGIRSNYQKEKRHSSIK